MGLVFLRDLGVRTVIGVEERERVAPQDLLVNVEMEADLDAAATSDDLAQSIDYAAVADTIRELAATARFRLLEALAGSIAAVILERFPRVRTVSVQVEKAWAVPAVRTVGVSIRRERGK